MSLHHLRIAHGFQSNRATERRIGFAIRHVAAHVRKLGPHHDSAILAHGTDRFRQFDPEPDRAEKIAGAQSILAAVVCYRRVSNPLADAS